MPTARRPDEVYALAAYLPFKNGVTREDEAMDTDTPSLPTVAMASRLGFALAWNQGMPRMQKYL